MVREGSVMEDDKKYKKSYRNRMKHIWITLVVQMIFAAVVIVMAFYSTWIGLDNDARKTSTNAKRRAGDIIRSYENSFKSILIPIKDKIAEDPSFDEMQTWLQSKEEDFRQGVGESAYDGIAFTYKGGYAHSWNYGDYSDYDASTRPWYQAAQEAKGDIVIVAPYVTYLSENNQEVDDNILMTIAQKYNDEISFDLDLKLPEIKGILRDINTLYPNENVIIYNNNGQIISCTNDNLFSHNIYQTDEVISSAMVDMSKNKVSIQEKLQMDIVDGQLFFLYFSIDDADNTICIMVPAAEIFWRNFFLLGLIGILLIGCFVYVFIKNKNNSIEFVERDHRLEVIEDTEQKERIYVDINHMTFYGNDMAQKNTSDKTYDSLYKLICSRMADESELPRLESFLSPEAVKQCIDEKYVIKKEQFFMNMLTEEGTMKAKTIEMRRLIFIQNKINMMEISMLDAAESIDILKEALDETKRLKQENEDEYNRFMGYICNAQDGVEELNIKEHTITRYYVKDNVLQKHTISYPGMPFELFHEDDRKLAHELYDEDRLAVLCQNQSVSYSQLRMKWYDAAEYHWCNVIVLGMPITEKTPFNVLVLIKDTDEIKTKEIKQKKALEDAFQLAEQASKAKGSFLSNMSHEIRTPLNAIIGYLTIANDSDTTQEKKDYCIENCQVASKHLLQIINDILDMSSIESGKLKISHEDFDLKKEITDLTTIFYQNARAKNVHFETHIEKVTEEWVVGDQLRLNQILMNFLSNAVKFTPEDGSVVLKVEQLRKDDQRVYMKFSVKDTGIGMSKEYMNRIFHPFEQENSGTARKYGGSGLGLSITNNLVQMMGGKIEVQSEPGVGSVFEVTMFFDLSTNAHNNKNNADYSHVRVLVVDDKDDECSYVKMMLKRCGARADTVTSGEDALSRIKSRSGGDYAYDMCIIDWNMPDMNGCEVTRKIRSELGEAMPIIIATAYDISEFEDEAKAAGANKVIAKPLFQSTLFDILVTSFGGYEIQNKTTQKENVDLSGVHILLAEDNPMNMDIAVTIIEKSGAKVDQAHDGKEAVEKFLASDKGTYNLILMDVQMPVMDGYEATETIRESEHPEAKTIPIVAMTANAFAEDVAEALSKGMNAHISKPISYNKLFDILKKFS